VGEPFSVEVKGLEDMNKALTDLEKKQLPFATSRAINNTLFKMRRDLQRVMERVFDRPTGLTLKSPLFKKSTKKRLIGRLWIRDDVGKGNAPATYLQPQIKGGGGAGLGVRGFKGFENLLRHRGFLPRGWYVMPAKGARLNKFGNFTPAKHKKILAELTIGGKIGKVFAVRRQSAGGLPPGIYERSGRGRLKATAVMIFVKKQPHYRPRLPFDATTERTFNNHFEKTFYKELDNALRTAR